VVRCPLDKTWVTLDVVRSELVSCPVIDDSCVFVTFFPSDVSSDTTTNIILRNTSGYPFFNQGTP